MKKIAMLVLAALISSVAFAKTVKESQLPAAVKNAFTKDFPGATHVKWDNDKSYYEASYKINDRNMLAIYDANGELLEADKEMKWEEFPAAVQNTMLQLGVDKFYYWYATENENHEAVYGCWYHRDHHQYTAVLSSKGHLDELREVK